MHILEKMKTLKLTVLGSNLGNERKKSNLSLKREKNKRKGKKRSKRTAIIGIENRKTIEKITETKNLVLWKD